MGLDAALNRFWSAADARRLGIDAVQVVADNGPHDERRRIEDIRRDVFSVSKTGSRNRGRGTTFERLADKLRRHQGLPCFSAMPRCRGNCLGEVPVPGKSKPGSPAAGTA
jgi:hypothetical protein